MNALIIDQPCWIGHAAFREYSRLESCGLAPSPSERLLLNKLCSALKFRQFSTWGNKEPRFWFPRCQRGQDWKMGTLSNAYTWFPPTPSSPSPTPPHPHAVPSPGQVLQKCQDAPPLQFSHWLGNKNDVKHLLEIQISGCYPIPLYQVLQGETYKSVKSMYLSKVTDITQIGDTDAGLAS